ncbi:extracellular solute-binding protein [Paenibacillus larvae]
MRKWKNKILAAALTFSLMVPVLSGCFKSDSSSEDEQTLRIATTLGFGADAEIFRLQYTELFEYAHPNTRIELIPIGEERSGGQLAAESELEKNRQDSLLKLKELMQGDHPPDVVMVNYDQLPELIKENRLLELDAKLKKDKFSLSGLADPVVKGIRQVGNGSLFALAPTFSSSALIYNKKIFDEAGIPYPKNNMNWEETFELAKKVTTGEGEDKKYGFFFSTQSQTDLFSGMLLYTAPLQMRMYDEQGTKMTVDTDEWEKSWNTILELNKAGVLPNPLNMTQDQKNMAFYDFISGKLAMGIVTYSQINQIAQANKQVIGQQSNNQKTTGNKAKSVSPIEWDVVSLPVHPGTSKWTPNLNLNGVMGINNISSKQKLALQYLEFVNGEEWARLRSKNSYNLMAQKKYNKPKDGLNYNIDAFIQGVPVPPSDYKLQQEKPNINMVQGMGRKQFLEVLQGNIGTREALKEWQASGNAFLQKLKNDPKAVHEANEVK